MPPLEGRWAAEKRLGGVKCSWFSPLSQKSKIFDSSPQEEPYFRFLTDSLASRSASKICSRVGFLTKGTASTACFTSR